MFQTCGNRGVHHAGCSKRLSSKAAVSEKARRTLRYVEPLSEARTPLADFFSILRDAPIQDMGSTSKAQWEKIKDASNILP